MPAYLALRASPVGRRRLIMGAAAAAAGLALTPSVVAADDGRGNHDHDAPIPKPIPGGLAVGDPLGTIHVWAAGKSGITLPFSHGQLQGIDTEPTTIGDFSGVSAVAFHVGTATGKNGKRYNLETDMRIFAGTYIAANGQRRQGAFGLI
jgi:hypothetical protein